MDAIQQAYDASYRRLVGQLYAVCGELTEAEDVVQEAFVRAVARRRAFESVANPEAWLRTAAVNVARSRFRRRNLGARLYRKAALDGVELHPDLTEDRLALVRAMRDLPVHYREALALHYLADLPVHEVAEATGVPVGTVKTRLARGRSQLAGLLGEGEWASEVEEDHA